MRFQTIMSWMLVAFCLVLSTVLWRGQRTDRILVGQLREQLAEAQITIDNLRAGTANYFPQPSSAAVTISSPEAAALGAASPAVVPPAAPSQKVLLGDSKYRDARLELALATVKMRFPNLAKDLGLSSLEADELFAILAQGQLNDEQAMASLVGLKSGAAMRELVTSQTEIAQGKDNAIAMLLGPVRAAEFHEYERTNGSRQRVTNLATMLQQAGKPLTAAQSKSLVALLITQERNFPKGAMTSQQRDELNLEGNRRVLEGAMAFLDLPQVELIRTRFEQIAARERAQSHVEQQEVEVANRAAGAQ